MATCRVCSACRRGARNEGTGARGNAVTDEEPLDAIIIDTIHNGQAQKFEFTVELFWKPVQVFLLEQHGFDIASPKGALKKYFELGYVGYDDCDRLIRALDIRNSLSHVYKKENFLDLYKEIRGYEGFFARGITGMRQQQLGI